jgi:serine/threonine-protein kinase
VQDPSIGTAFTGYRIEELLGRGGMGVVYRAIDTELDRTVALKLLAPELAHDESFRRRFVSESKIAASLEHPHVIPIYRAGESEGRLFIAMRYVSGQDLRERLLQSGRLEPGLAARLLQQVAAALDAAHAESLVHRDVKPANVLLGRADHAYLSDFGLSKRTTDDRATATGQLVGTLDYIAPEQIRGEGIGVHTDVYALGCMAFHLLTGSVPFPVSTQEGKLLAHIQEPPPRPSRLVPGLASGFDAVLARAMRKQPERRYPTAGQLGDAIAREAAAQEAAGGRRVGRSGTSRRPKEAPLTAAAEKPRPAPRPVAPRPASGDGRLRRLVTAAADPFNIVVVAVLLVIGAALGALRLMVPLALVVYAVAVARSWFEIAPRRRAPGPSGPSMRE